MEWYADKLEAFSYSAAQIVNPKLEDVAGLGQLSYAALSLLHGPIMELTDTKRLYWSKWGLSRFFERMLQAAGQGKVAVECAWSEYFPIGGVDKQIELANISAAIQLGLPFDIATQWLARIIGITEDQMPEFLKKAEADMETRQKLQEAVEMLNATVKATSGAGGPQGTTRPGQQSQRPDGGTKGAARKSA
jgi:hypothetical protein